MPMIIADHQNQGSFLPFEILSPSDFTPSNMGRNKPNLGTMSLPGFAGVEATDTQCQNTIWAGRGGGVKRQVTMNYTRITRVQMASYCSGS